MRSLKFVGSAVLVRLLVLIVPSLFPTGPSTGAVDFSLPLYVVLPTMFGFGLLTALTPCVYPLIPITMSIFGAKKETLRSKKVLLTLTYILGIAVMFTTAGIFAGLSGQLFGSILSNKWVVTGLALFFTAMAISMFGGWDFTLPSGLQTRLSSVGKAGFGGAFFMGLVAGIVAAPCTGAPLSSALLYVSQTRDAVFGGVFLFTYALGLGFPFFLIGTFSLSLPKAGPWMDAVKSVFGIALLALALMYLRDAFPALRRILSFEHVAFGAIVAALVSVVGMLLGAVHRSYHDALPSKILKTVGIFLVVMAVVWRPHALFGRPVESTVTWHPDEASIVAASKGQKPVVIDFGAEWCAACKELEKITFIDPTFLSEATRWNLVRIDATDDEDPTVELLKKKYGVLGLPTVILIDSQGKVREDLTVTGFVSAEDFVGRMQKVQ